MPDYQYSIDESYEYPKIETWTAQPLTIGSYGEPVRQMQVALNTTMGANLDVDRIFGPQTQQAIRDFQFSEGLKASGVADRLTQEALIRNYKPLMVGLDEPTPWFVWIGLAAAAYYFFASK